MWTSLSLHPTRGTTRERRRPVRLAREKAAVWMQRLDVFLSPGNEKDRGRPCVCGTELPR